MRRKRKSAARHGTAPENHNTEQLLSSKKPPDSQQKINASLRFLRPFRVPAAPDGGDR
jgi:hypothetical protein